MRRWQRIFTSICWRSYARVHEEACMHLAVHTTLSIWVESLNQVGRIAQIKNCSIVTT